MADEDSLGLKEEKDMLLNMLQTDNDSKSDRESDEDE